MLECLNFNTQNSGLAVIMVKKNWKSDAADDSSSGVEVREIQPKKRRRKFRRKSSTRRSSSAVIRQKTDSRLELLANSLDIDDHIIELDELCKRYKTDLELGITPQLAQKRLVQYGLNRLTPTTIGFGFLKLLKAIFGGFSLLLWFGVLVCGATIAVDYYVLHLEIQFDTFYLAGVLVSIAVILGCLSHYQHSKSYKVIDSFKKSVPHHANVTRNGITHKILAEELVRGDLVELKFGDRVPADIRIISSRGFKVDNSALTGDSEPQFRSPEFTNDNPLETQNLAFFSTNVIEGTCMGIVVNTGDNTVVGKIVGSASLAATLGETRIAKAIRRLNQSTFSVAIVLGSCFTILGASLGYNLLRNLISLVGIIVAIVPEGLQVTFLICLILIAKRLAQKNCLVINLETVEILGSASVIITDATGTLTQNVMTVAHIYFDGQIFESAVIEGHTDDLDFDKNSIGFKDLARCAILCSQTELKHNLEMSQREIKKAITSGATENAVLKFMDIVVGNLEEYLEKYPRIHEIPFSSTHKYQVSIHRIISNSGDGKPVKALLTMKGAPERIFERCSTVVRNGREYLITHLDRANFLETYKQLGGLGERVLGFCDLILPGKYGEEDFEFDTDEPNFPINSLRFLGLISMIDPPRSTVPHAIEKCKAAGIKVIMVTGDHPLTATALAHSIGIISTDIENLDKISSISKFPGMIKLSKTLVMHGGVLNELTEEELDEIILSYDEIIFARTTPRQKVSLVESCQRLGLVAAVTGSGVSDALALQKGDIGMAMGIAGSDVAKQAADMILLDDNFATIVAGVEEGRLIYENLKKCIAYTLTSNVPEIAPFFISLIFGVPLPVGIIHILCIDMGTDLIPAISIAYELQESDIMKRMPRGPKDWIINRRLISSTIQIGLIETLAGLYSYFVIMLEYGFLPWDLMNVRGLWDSSSVNDFVDSYGQQWTFEARKDLQFTAQTGYFVAVVIVQWANLIICKTSRNSVLQQGMKNWVLNFGLVFETCLAALLTYAPGAKNTLKTNPLKWWWWMIPFPFAIFVFIYDEIRKCLIRRYVGGWVEDETFF